MAFPKNAKKYNNNVAFPTGRLWRAHCVNNSEGCKIVKARKGLKPLVIRNKDANCISIQGVETALLLRIWNSILYGLLRFTRNDGSEVIHIHKFVNFLNNNVASAHCVNNSEGRKIVKARKGFPERGAERKPLVIRNKDAKNINNNAALAHCVHLQIGCKSKTDLLLTSINSDNLSEKIKNLCFVINNFNLIKEDIHMRISKKILTIILAISLLFAISCGDRPTGSGDVDNQINALFDKFPKPSTATDTAVSSSDGLDGNYKSDGNLAIVPDETDAINYPYATKEDFIKNESAKAGFLDISGGKATGYLDDKTIGKLFENVQIYKSSGKYYAVNEITYEEGGYERNYIEFDKDSSGNLTSFKIMRLVRANGGGYNYAFQQTYTGTLLKI